MTKLRPIEKKVLEVYSRVNPSIIKIQKEKDWEKFLQKRHNLLKLLAIPEQIFQDKKLLDIGGGSGEKSLYYQLMGAQITILDPNNKSLEFAKKLFSKEGYKIKTILKNLSEFDFNLINKFDIVVCEGVLHHTAFPKKNLHRILRNLSRGSLFILGIAETHGWYKRNLQREFLRKISKNSEEKIIENSKKYFQSHINRKVKFGQRTEKTVIYDSWINSQIQPLSLKEICDAFFQNRLEYISSHPSITPFLDVISHNEIQPDYYNYGSYSLYYSFLEKVWMCYEGNKFDIINDVKIIDKEIKKLLGMKRKLDKGNLSGRDFSQWKNSRMGVGINYFVGKKKFLTNI